MQKELDILAKAEGVSNKEYFLNFNLLFTNKIEQKDIEILLRVAKEREIQINETKLIKFY